MLVNQTSKNTIHNLGLCYEDGDGVIPSIEKALKYYTIAAEKGNVYGIDLLNQLQNKISGNDKRRMSNDYKVVAPPDPNVVEACYQ